MNDDGIINTEAFYNYLTAWVSIDAMKYAASMADFHPAPTAYIHDAYDMYDHKSKLIVNLNDITHTYVQPKTGA